MAQARNVWLAVAVFFLCSSSESQTSPPQSQNSSTPTKQQVEQPATVLKVTTRLVVVDVVATDGHGRAVTDLKPEDFTITEDGKRQEVRVFSFHHPPLARATSAAEKAPKLPPNVFSNIPRYSREQSLNIILLDFLNTDFEDQAYARQQVLKYLGNIPDGEPVAVALYTLGRKLRLVQDFTNDFGDLRNAVNGVKDQRSLAQDSSAVGVVIDNPVHVRVKELSKVYEGTEQLDRRVQYTLEGLAELAKNLSGYPGRKNLIWISAAFPIGIAPDDAPGLYTFDKLRDYEQAMASVSQALVDAQVAVYPVDPRGPLSAVQYAGQHNDALDRDPATGIPEYSSMKRVAQFTGGVAFYNQNNLDDAIRSSIADGATYYTLAYYPVSKNWNGAFRRIAVKVDRPDVKLRHRPGYYAIKARDTQAPGQMFAAFSQALNIDSPISTGFRFEAGVVQPSEETQNRVFVNFALDPHAVSFEKQDDGLQHATVDCAVQAYTEKGQLIKTDAGTLNVALDAQAFSKTMESYLLARVPIDLPPGPYVLRLGVMDEHTGLIGTTNARVTVNASTTVPGSKPGEKKPSSNN